MNRDDFKAWLDAYGRAWSNRDPQAVADLFTEDAVYLETPYQDPIRGRAGVVRYWEHLPRTQEDIRFRHEVLSFAGDTGLAHWWASFARIPSGKRVHLDGVLVATFATAGKCRLFREWWHKREVAAVTGETFQRG